MPSISVCASAAGRRVSQPSEDAKRARVPCFLRRGGNRGRPHFGVVREPHALGHDADNRRRLPVHAHRRAEHVRIGAIAVLPEGIADDDDRFGALALVGGREVAAEQSRLPEQAERVGGDPGAARLFRQRAGIADVHRAVAKGPEPGKRATPLTPFLELDVRHLPPSGAALPGQHVEPIRPSKGRPRRKAALMSVNPTALTPIPRASATTAAAENQRSLAMSRKVKRRSRSMRDETGPNDEKFRNCVEGRLS